MLVEFVDTRGRVVTVMKRTFKSIERKCRSYLVLFCSLDKSWKGV